MRKTALLIFLFSSPPVFAFSQSDIISVTQFVDIRLSDLKQSETFFICTAYNSDGTPLDTTSAYVEGAVDVVSLDFQTREAVASVKCRIDDN